VSWQQSPVILWFGAGNPCVPSSDSATIALTQPTREQNGDATPHKTDRGFNCGDSALNRLAEASRGRSRRKAVDERAIAEPEWIEGTVIAISMGSAIGGLTNCAMMEWCR
jgi:hypothetical protein